MKIKDTGDTRTAMHRDFWAVTDTGADELNGFVNDVRTRALP
ncbi:protein of unknown function [Pararobbsia alpina]